MKILAARSVGSSETCGVWTSGFNRSSTPMEIAVFPWPTLAPGVHAAASAGRSPYGIEHGIAAWQRVIGTSCARAAAAIEMRRIAAADALRITASGRRGRTPRG